MQKLVTKGRTFKFKMKIIKKNWSAIVLNYNTQIIPEFNLLQ